MASGTIRRDPVSRRAMMAGGGVRAAAVCAAAALAAAALAVPVAAERAVVQAPAALDFAAEGGVADDDSLSTRTSNRDLLNALLSTDRLPPGSSLALAPGDNSRCEDGPRALSGSCVGVRKVPASGCASMRAL